MYEFFEQIKVWSDAEEIYVRSDSKLFNQLPVLTDFNVKWLWIA